MVPTHKIFVSHAHTDCETLHMLCEARGRSFTQPTPSWRTLKGVESCTWRQSLHEQVAVL
jgi:hypothetical protein